jgi:hypothetical protein
MNIMIDEYGRPILLLQDQDKKKRVKHLQTRLGITINLSASESGNVGFGESVVNLRCERLQLREESRCCLSQMGSLSISASIDIFGFS